MPLGVEYGAVYTLEGPARFNSGNKVLNPSFEDATTSPWSFNTTSWVEPTATISTSIFAGSIGEHVGKFTVKKDATGTPRAFYLTMLTAVNTVTAGALYSASALMNIVDNAANGIVMWLTWCNAAGGVVSEAAAISATAMGNGIVQFNIRNALAPAGASRVQVVFSGSSAVSSDTVDLRLDNVDFHEHTQRAVFNDPTDVDYVGVLNAESSGLDSADVREDAQDGTERDGGIHGNFFQGRRPIVLQGTVLATTKADRAAKIAKIKKASAAFRADATLSWPAEGLTGGVSTAVRRQQAVRFSKAWVKDFMLALVAADPFIYGPWVTAFFDYTAPAATSELNTVATSVAAAGVGFNWLNVNNVKISDNVYATCTAEAAGSSNELKPAFAFAIPATGTITGIKVEVERKASLAGVTDSDIHVFKPGQNGSNQAAVGNWPLADEYKVYGGPGNMMGLTSLTPAEANAAGFGVAIKAAMTGTQTASVDHVAVTIYYESNSEPHEQTIVTGPGDEPTPPIFKITGPTTPVWYLKNLVTGKSIKVERKLGVGEVLTIDVRNRSVLSEGVTNVYNAIDFANTTWWCLQPGFNAVQLPPCDKAEVLYRDAYL